MAATAGPSGSQACAEDGAPKNMDRWLGDGGMEVIGLVGASFTAYGVDGEDLGWVEATWTPTALACNPHGTAQAGIHSLILDAAMNFAINAALAGKDRTRGTLEMKTETMRPAQLGDRGRGARRSGAHGPAGRLRRGHLQGCRRPHRQPAAPAPSSCIATPEARRPGRRGCVA